MAAYRDGIIEARAQANALLAYYRGADWLDALDTLQPEWWARLRNVIDIASFGERFVIAGEYLWSSIRNQRPRKITLRVKEYQHSAVVSQYEHYNVEIRSLSQQPGKTKFIIGCGVFEIKIIIVESFETSRFDVEALRMDSLEVNSLYYEHEGYLEGIVDGVLNYRAEYWHNECYTAGPVAMRYEKKMEKRGFKIVRSNYHDIECVASSGKIIRDFSPSITCYPYFPLHSNEEILGVQVPATLAWIVNCVNVKGIPFTRESIVDCAVEALQILHNMQRVTRETVPFDDMLHDVPCVIALHRFMRTYVVMDALTGYGDTHGDAYMRAVRDLENIVDGWELIADNGLASWDLWPTAVTKGAASSWHPSL